MIVIQPQIDPIAIHLGKFAIHWYGLAYLAGFLWVWHWSLKAIQATQIISKADLENLLSNLMLSLLIGGRVGYMLFYQTPTLIHNPLQIFKIWQGGMSFHGALIGVVLGGLYFAKKLRINLFVITDLILPWVPFGIGLGRLANFINSELWGRVTNSNWGVIFPLVDFQARHPSQIYEFLGEGLILGIIMYYVYKKSNSYGYITATFLIYYGVIRFFLEYFREPDLQIGFLFNANITLGQILSIPLIVAGAILLKKNSNTVLN